jgi:hypothetical protein
MSPHNEPLSISDQVWSAWSRQVHDLFTDSEKNSRAQTPDPGIRRYFSRADNDRELKMIFYFDLVAGTQFTNAFTYNM